MLGAVSFLLSFAQTKKSKSPSKAKLKDSKYWLIGLTTACLATLSVSSLAAELRPEAWQATADYQQTGGHIEVDQWVEDGAFVPITLHLAGAKAPLSISLTRSDDAEPRIAQIEVQRWHEPLQLSTRVRLPKIQAIEAWVRDGAGRQWHFTQEVQVLGSSCYAPLLSAPVFGPPQASLQTQGSAQALRTLLPHPMETGLRQNAQGQPLAQHLLQAFEVSQGAQLLFRVKPYAGLAANPYWHWLLPTGSAAIQVRWEDSSGQVWERVLE